MSVFIITGLLIVILFVKKIEFIIVVFSFDPVSNRIILFTFHSSVFHHYFFMFRFNLLETEKLIYLENLLVVMVLLSYFTTVLKGFDYRCVISIDHLSYGIISDALHILHGCVHMPLVFRGCLFIGKLCCYTNLLYKIVASCIFMSKASFNVLIFFVFLAYPIKGTIIYPIFIEISI